MKLLRNVIVVLLVLLPLATIAAGGDQESESAEEGIEVYQTRLAHIFPRENPFGLGAEFFAERLNELSDGRIEVQIFPNEQLGNEKDLFDAVSAGAVEFAVTGYGEAGKRYPPALIVDAPYISRDREHHMRIINSDVFAEIAQGVLEASGARTIGAAYYGTRFLTTTNTPVESPEGLDGLKIRVPGNPMVLATVEAIGATPNPMSFSEVYLALQQGVVDGQENPPATIFTSKFYEVQQYIVNTGHAIQANMFYVSDAFYQTLPADLQQAVIQAGIDTAEWTTRESFALEDAYLEDLIENGMTYIEPDKSLFEARVSELYSEFEETWGVGLLDRIKAVN